MTVAYCRLLSPRPFIIARVNQVSPARATLGRHLGDSLRGPEIRHCAGKPYATVAPAGRQLGRHFITSEERTRNVDHQRAATYPSTTPLRGLKARGSGNPPKGGFPGPATSHFVGVG